MSPLADETGDRAEVDLEAGREGDRGLLAHELGQPLLEPDVEVERAVQEPAPARSRTRSFRIAVDRGLLDAGIVGQAEVVVGAHHDQAPAAR